MHFDVLRELCGSTSVGMQSRPSVERCSGEHWFRRAFERELGAQSVLACGQPQLARCRRSPDLAVADVYLNATATPLQN